MHPYLHLPMMATSRAGDAAGNPLQANFTMWQQKAPPAAEHHDFSPVLTSRHSEHRWAQVWRKTKVQPKHWAGARVHFLQCVFLLGYTGNTRRHHANASPPLCSLQRVPKSKAFVAFAWLVLKNLPSLYFKNPETFPTWKSQKQSHSGVQQRGDSPRSTPRERPQLLLPDTNNCRVLLGSEPFFLFFPTCTSGDVSFKFRSALDMLCFTPEKQLCLKTLLLIIFKCPYRCPSQEANAEEVGTHIIPEHPGGNAELSVALLGSASLPAPLFLMTAQHALPKHSSAVNKQNEAMFSKTHAVSQTLQCRIQQIPFNVMCIYPYITYVNGFDVRDARSWKIYLFFYIWEREFSQAIALGWICCFKISFQPHTCKDNYCELKAKHAELIPKTCRWLCKYCCKGLLPRNVE